MQKDKSLPNDYFVQKLCYDVNRLGRDFLHDEHGITVLPWMAEDFKVWMKSKGKSAETIKDTVSRLKSIDRYVFDSFAYTEVTDETIQLNYFFINLKLLFEHGNRMQIERLLESGEKWIRKFRSVVKEYDIGDDAIRNWLTAFGHYRLFIVEKFVQKIENEIIEKPTSMNLSAEDLGKLKEGTTVVEGVVVKSRLRDVAEALTNSINCVSSLHGDLKPKGLAMMFDFDKSIGIGQVNDIMGNIPRFEEFERFIWGADFIERKQMDFVTIKIILTYGE